MQRLLVLALLSLGLTIAFVPTATPAAPGDAQGPPCANITGGDPGYSVEGVITFDLFLQAPACSFVNYSFVVTDTSGNTLPGTLTQNADCTPETPDGGCVHFVYTLASENGFPSVVCYSATTDIQGRHVADLAPNASDPTCPPSSPSFSVAIGSGGAAGGFD